MEENSYRSLANRSKYTDRGRGPEEDAGVEGPLLERKPVHQEHEELQEDDYHRAPEAVLPGRPAGLRGRPPVRRGVYEGGTGGRAGGKEKNQARGEGRSPKANGRV